jgi:hypothetical protein
MRIVTRCRFVGQEGLEIKKEVRSRTGIVTRTSKSRVAELNQHCRF